MPLDYHSLLLAIGFAGAGLAVAMFGSWISSRADGFLLTWAVGVALVVLHVFTYSTYVETPGPALLALTFALLMGGLSLLYGAAGQFREGVVRWRAVVALAAATMVCLSALAASGLDGLVFIVANLFAVAIMSLTAYQYWLARQQSPASVGGIALLYAITAATFLPCALVLALDGKLVLGHAPDNWAEDLNLIVSIGGITGIGALSLALNQARHARSHRRDAMTDALTGLLNRRALFDRIGNTPLDRFTGVLLFDLDRFKLVNDEFGHVIGDEVLRRFAAVMSDQLRGHDIAARLGGEEFVAVLPRTTTDRAHQAAEKIRKTFAECVIDTVKGPIKCTVSVGIAFPTGDMRSFDQVLDDADSALYRAKHGGRNRVAAANLRLAG